MKLKKTFRFLLYVLLTIAISMALLFPAVRPLLFAAFLFFFLFLWGGAGPGCRYLIVIRSVCRIE